MDQWELRLGGLHAGEETGPGRGWVADMEVNVVKMLVRHQTGIKLSNHTALQSVQRRLCLRLFGWFQFDNYLEASTKL